jgi:hypothetical protein
MCKLYVSDAGTIYAAAIINISPINFKKHACESPIEPTEENIEFIVDTGAQVTCLSGLDAERLQIDTRYLEPATDVIGISGMCNAFKLNDIEIGLVDEFTAGGVNFHIEPLENICVINTLKMHSLLGNDILARFDISTDRQRNIAELKRITSAQGNFRIVFRSWETIKRRLPK